MNLPRRGPWVAAALAGLAGCVILGVTLWLEPAAETPQAPKPRIVEAGDVAGPSGLRPDEARSASCESHRSRTSPRW